MTRGPKRTTRTGRLRRGLGRWPFGLLFVLAGSALLTFALVLKPREEGLSDLFHRLIFQLHIPVVWSDFTGWEALKGTLIAACLLSGLLFVVLRHLLARRVRKYRRIAFWLAVLYCGGMLLMFSARFGMEAWLAEQREQNEAWCTWHVPVEGATLIFPQEKRNLIYITMESMESSFMDRAHGGSQVVNWIPRLTDLMQRDDAVSFSHRNGPGGARQVSGTQWTLGALVGEMSGVPCHFPVYEDRNAFRSKDGTFMTKTPMLGDLLKAEGYHCEMLMGSEGRFASRDQLYGDHGYELKDLTWAQSHGVVPPDYRDGWGYDDRRLFDFARERLMRLGKSDRPFALNLLTVDTHFPTGYVYGDRERLASDDFVNSVMWSDRDVADFVEWCLAQPFASNTTLVLIGDHLCMGGHIESLIAPEYERHIYNLIINPAVSCPRDVTVNRDFSCLDYFPTVLAALGVEIRGDQLACGVNLFSGRPTLFERHGSERVAEMLGHAPCYYDRAFWY